MIDFYRHLKFNTLNFKLTLVCLMFFMLTCGGIYFFINDTENNPKQNLVGTKHHHSRQKNEEKPIPVAVQSVYKADYPIYFYALGTVTPLKTVTIHSRIEGEITKLFFSEGQMVKKGDLLAEIDPRPFQILLKQAEGQMQQDMALLRNAEIDLLRYQTLREKDSIATQQTNTQQSLVKQYESLLEVDQAKVNNAKLQLEFTRLISPIDGQIGLRQIDQGNIIHTNDGLVIINQLVPINAVFNLAEDKLAKLMQRAQSKNPISVEAYDRSGKNKLATGKLIAIDNELEATTVSIKLKALFKNSEMNLFPNQFINIKMHIDTLPDMAMIPSAAVQHDEQGSFVFVMNSKTTAEFRRISVAEGETEDGKVAVLNNMATDELVIVEGLDKLKPDSDIDIAEKNGEKLAALTDRPARQTDKKN